jgi:hypothetical protein
MTLAALHKRGDSPPLHLRSLVMESDEIERTSHFTRRLRTASPRSSESIAGHPKDMVYCLTPLVCKNTGASICPWHD